MNIFFDVDSTIIAYDGSLRPMVKEVFRKLKEDGHDIFIWSGIGLRWEIIRMHKLEEFVSGCYVKPLYEHKNLKALGINVNPDFCIDDYPEFISSMGGIAVHPYERSDPEDREMLRVYQAISGGNHHGRGDGQT